VIKSAFSLENAARTIQICLVILTILAVASVLTYTKPVLVPFVFAIFTYAIFAPIVYWIQVHLKLPRMLAITAALAGVIGVAVCVVIIMFPALKQLIYGMSSYDAYIANILTAVENKMPGVQIDKNFILEQAKAFNPASYVRDFTQGTFVLIGNLTLVLIYTAFMIVGDQNAQIKSPLLRTIMIKIFEYTIKKLFLALGAGVIFLVLLGSFRIELTLIFALAAIFLNFIPTIGPIVAVALPLPVVFYAYGLEWPFFAILIVLATAQFIIGNIVEPIVLKDIMDLHPITILVCLVLWALIWGISGMFLAVPITAVVKIVFQRIDATQPFAEILAGRIPNYGDEI
jgi:AI-2 transport protein TqsA